MFAQRLFSTVRRLVFTAIVAKAVSAVLGSSAIAGEEPIDFRALITRYRCPIYDRLVRIHDAGDPRSDRHRFLSVALPDGTYVQCLFHDTARKLLCEADSRFYEAKPGERRTAFLPPASVAALGKLGFDTDGSHGNFRVDLDVAREPDYTAIADLILRALYVGYGARADMTLTIDAPFAPDITSTCDATS